MSKDTVFGLPAVAMDGSSLAAPSSSAPLATTTSATTSAAENENCEQLSTVEEINGAVMSSDPVHDGLDGELGLPGKGNALLTHPGTKVYDIALGERGAEEMSDMELLTGNRPGPAADFALRGAEENGSVEDEHA